MIFIGILLLLVFLLPFANYLFRSDILMIVAAGIALCIFLAIQIEIYRRIVNILTGVKERYLFMDTIDVIRTRRSIRKFSTQPVKEKDVRKMLDAARWAPNGSHAQPWRFIVIQDREMLARMGKIVRVKIDELPRPTSFKNGWYEGSLFFANAPITIAILFKNIPEFYPESDVNWIIEKRGCSATEAHNYMGYVELMSVSAAIENLLLAAHSLGYGACWLRVPFMAREELEEMFSVETPWELTALVPVGRAAQSPSAPCRKKIEEFSTFYW
jgi:nitroreductase